MVALDTGRERLDPFGLVVNGEAGEYVDALRMIVGSRWIQTFPARTDREVLELVRHDVPDAVFLPSAWRPSASSSSPSGWRSFWCRCTA